METIESVKSKLKSIIANDLEANIELASIHDDISLYDDGIGLDSISIVNLMVLIEKKFELSFDEEDINTSTFSTVNSLAAYINKKKHPFPSTVH